MSAPVPGFAAITSCLQQPQKQQHTILEHGDILPTQPAVFVSLCFKVYRNIEQYPAAEMVPGVLVVRLDAPVYFANVQWMQDKLTAYEQDALRWGCRVVLSCCVCNKMNIYSNLSLDIACQTVKSV